MRKRPTTRIIIFIALLFVIIQSVYSQPTITGFVTEVTSKVTVSEEKQVKKFKVGFYLQIHNPYSEPLLLLDPKGFFGTWKISFLSPSGSVEETYTSTLKERQIERHSELKQSGARGLIYDPENYDWLGNILARLEKEEQPTDRWFAIIQPGSYYEFRDTFDLDSGFEIDEDAVAKAIALDRKYYNARIAKEPELRRFPFSSLKTPLIRKARSPYLRIEYQLSTRSYTKDPELLKTLQSRWRKFGIFPLDGDTFRLKTEPMLINLPDSDGNP